MKTIPPVLLCVLTCALFACNKTEFNSANHITASSLDDQTLGSITSREMSSFLQPRSDDYAAIPQDPNNPLTAEKIELGKLLFHESRLGRAEAGIFLESAITNLQEIIFNLPG